VRGPGGDGSGGLRRAKGGFKGGQYVEGEVEQGARGGEGVWLWKRGDSRGDEVK